MSLFRRKTAESTPLSEGRFAVVDCETTGLFPGAHHRMIELAIIQLDGVEDPVGEWSTLLNPRRDLGDADIHGIRGRDVRDAPAFEDVVGSILALLAGRVVVAHNARFDCAFLEAELARAGYDVAPVSRLCTIEMSRTLGINNGSARLVDCCQAHGIPVNGQHRAASDAHLCAALLREYTRQANETGWTALEHFGCRPPVPGAAWPSSSDRAAPLPREIGSTRGAEESFLSGLVVDRAGLDDLGAEATAYADLLDGALEDRRLTDSERQDLIAAAGLYDLSGAQVERLHDQYLDSICAAALLDGVVTERERYDLQLVAELLGVRDLDRRLEQVDGLALGEEPSVEDGAPDRDDLVGMTVCFTGKLLCSHDGQELTRERARQLAESAGLIVQPGVTKKLDVLVVADPETASGKARKAREYGTRVIAETEFWRKIGVEVT